MSKLSNLLEKSVSRAEVEGVTSVGAHGTAEKASVPVHHPVDEVGISEDNLEYLGEEFKTGEVWDQELSAEDSMELANAKASEGVKKEDAIDALLEVPRK